MIESGHDSLLIYFYNQIKPYSTEYSVNNSPLQLVLSSDFTYFTPESLQRVTVPPVVHVTAFDGQAENEDQTTKMCH